MGENANAFTPLLWGWSAVLLLFFADRLCCVQVRRLRSLLPLLLLLGGLWLAAELVDLGQRGQAALAGWPPLQSFNHALHLPPPS